MFATPIKFISTIFFAIAASSVFGAYAPDEITSLPGWTGALPSKQYSGYLNFTSSGTTNHIHYWLVTSESSTAATDPVVVWFNGGPGCSSLDGFVYEQGPFEFNNNATVLTLRLYRWNLIANVVFIEQPVGVGFSYNENAKYHLNDDKAASDNLQAIQTFYAMFPEYKANKFFITGESYAGVYVPTLAESILKATEAGTYTGATLTGIAVGNGCSGTEVGICGSGSQGTYYEWSYLTQTSFVQLQLKNEINAQCNWTAAAANQPNALSNACVALLNKASSQIQNVNLYDIYGDCVDNMCSASHSWEEYSRMSKAEIKALNLPKKSKVPPRADIVGYDEPNPSKQRRLQRIIPHGPDACIDSQVASAYFNRADVMAAIHVRDPGFCWAVCNDAPGWTYQSTRTNLPANTYPYLNANIQVVIYNGDWDACVPYTDGYGWTNGMNYPVQTEWHAWNYTSGAGNPGQVAGYAIQYNVAASTNNNLRTNIPKGQNGNSFTFVTVKGGRHEVPESAGYQALQMITNLINNTPF